MVLADRQPTTEEVIVDAAEDCFATVGVRRTTIEDIAAAAGVSRITVYRRVGGREEIVLAVLVRTTERFLSRLRPRLLAQPTLEDALVLLVRATARAARRDDLSLLFASEERGAVGAPLPGAMVRLAAVFGEVIGFVAERRPGRLTPGVDLIDAGEWLLRVIVSLATTEPARPRTQAQTDDWVRRLALPGLLVQDDTLPELRITAAGTIGDRG
jgi:AcrR family transcriptional regulator